MRCAILLPSLGRSQFIAEVLENIEEHTPEEHEIFLMVTDDYREQILTHPAGHVSVLFDDDDPDRRYVTRMNKLARRVREVGGFHDVFYGSDDVIFHPAWLQNARKVQAQGFGCVVVNDVRNQSGTQALMTVEYMPRACFDDPEAVFHHGYQHNFADTEQFRTAAAQGELARSMNSVVEHLHPNYRETHKARPIDSTYTNAQASWDQDAALFDRRMRELVFRYA